MEDEQMLVPLAPQAGKQDMMVNISANFIMAGGSVGSSKSYSSLLRSLRFVDCPYYRGGYFRRNITDIRGPGGLLEEAIDMYSRFNVRVKDKEMKIIFPSGAEISFHHLDDEKKVKQRFSGLQLTGIHIDEVQFWSEESVIFLSSRLRSKSKYPSYMFLTGNPEPPPHWLHKWVDWYLLHEEDIESEEDLYKAGRANQEKTGVYRHYVMEGNTPIFSDNPESLKRDFPHLCRVENLNTGEWEEIEPKTFTFIGATIFDNQKLINLRPEYLQELNALPDIERERLLYGNWYVRPEGSNYFSRDWLLEADFIPPDCNLCRAWDKAYTEPSDKNRNPDYTAGSPLMGLSKDGKVYIAWDFHPDIRDNPTTPITGQFRKRPGDRDNLILKQAMHDGPSTVVVLAKDASGAGQQEFDQASQSLLDAGFMVRPDPMPTQTGKLARFSPFSSAAQNGRIYIVKSSFPNKETYDAYMKHLENFTGEKSKGLYHDDWADATASAYNYINSSTYIPDFIMPTPSKTTTRYRNVMSEGIPSFGESLMNRGGHLV